MWGDKPEPGPQDKGLCVTPALRVSDSSQYPLTLSIFKFQLDTVWLAQRGGCMEDIRVRGCETVASFSNGEGMKHHEMNKRNRFDPSFDGYSIFH